MARLKVRNIVVPRYENVVGARTRCIPVTNSERGLLGCSAKYRYGAVAKLRTKNTSDKLLFGSCWHKCLERFHLYAKEGTTDWFVEDVVDDALMDVRKQDLNGYPDIDWQEFKVRLLPLFNAWLERGAWDLATNQYRVVAVEKELAVPVVDPRNGKLFKPVTALTRTNTGYAVAGFGNQVCSTVRWPYYQFFTLDALYQCRQTGNLWVFEAKTAASPKQRIQTALMDPQLSGYCYATQLAVQSGLIDGVKNDAEVTGYIFDAVCNKPMSKPKINKNGSLSKQTKPTSYALRSWIREEKLDPEDYMSEILNAQMMTDGTWFQQVTGTCGVEVRERFALELFGSVNRIAKHKSDATKCKTTLDVHAAFPRTPICMGGWCQYKSICLQDDPIGRLNFETSEGVKWPFITKEEEEKELSW